MTTLVHGFRNLGLTCAVAGLMAAAAGANAQETPKKEESPLKDWTVSAGIVNSHSTRTTYSSPSKSWGNTAVLSAVKREDAKTFYGGSLAYNLGKSKSKLDSGTTDTDVISGSVFAMRLLPGLIMLDGNLAYGRVGLDNSHISGTTTVNFTTDSNFVAAGVGATKIIPINKSFTATVSARYSYNYSDSEAYRDSTSTQTPGDTANRSLFSLGTGISWRVDEKWTPSAKLNWTYSSAELHNATSDKDYFNYTVGTSYAIDPATKVSVGYTGSFGKAETRDRSISLTMSWAF